MLMLTVTNSEKEKTAMQKDITNRNYQNKLRKKIRNLTFTLVNCTQRCWSPWLLDKSRAADVTLLTTGVVLTPADQFSRVFWVSPITVICMTIADTLTAN